MRTEAISAFLEVSRPGTTEVSSEIGRRGDAAYLRMESTDEPERWAVVSSPGDRWFSLDVDGGFCLDHVEEDTPDSDAHRIMQEYIEVGLCYLREGATPVRSRRLRLPGLQISTAQGDVVLRRSLVANLKSLMRISRRS